MIIENLSILQGDYEGPGGREFDKSHELQTYPNDRVRIVIPKKFEDEVNALCKYAGVDKLIPGSTIKITLQEMLGIIPKNRARIDSYNLFVRYLKDEMNVVLDIKSRKSNNKEHHG